jgi:glutaminyl-peptide cyclotransferase
MMGDRDLDVTLPPDSPPKLAKGIFDASEALGTRDHFGYFRGDILDDHVPLEKAGIPSIDIIDFDFPAWHTPADTLDKVSAQSLQIVGQATLYHLSKIAPELK